MTEAPKDPRSPSEKEDDERAALYDYHKRAGTLEMYYELFPYARPPRRHDAPERTAAAELDRDDMDRDR